MANKEMILIRHTFVDKVAKGQSRQLISKTEVTIADIMNPNMYLNFMGKVTMAHETLKQAYQSLEAMFRQIDLVIWHIMSMIINKTVTKQWHPCCQIQLYINRRVPRHYIYSRHVSGC